MHNTYFEFQGRRFHQSEKPTLEASLVQLRKYNVEGSWMTGDDGRTVCWIAGGRIIWSGLGTIGGK